MSIISKNRLDEYEFSKIMSDKLQKNEDYLDNGKVCKDKALKDSVKIVEELKIHQKQPIGATL